MSILKLISTSVLCMFLLSACGPQVAPTAAANPTDTIGAVTPSSAATDSASAETTPTGTWTALPIVISDPPTTPEPETEIPIYGYNVLAEYPHDPNAFTQGLILVDGVLYEGTGLRGQSTLRRVDLESGEVLQGVRLPDQFFGEGITLFDNRIYQLTWTSNTGFIFDPESFELIDTFTYPTQGWGLTHDGEKLIMSDGTPTLYFLDPATLERIGEVAVTANGEPVRQINELEYIDGLVYANIWQTDYIVKIDPTTGAVVATIDMTGLFPPDQRSDPQAVLNGIAYDAENDRLYVTGKLWPSLYWIELVPPDNAE